MNKKGWYSLQNISKIRRIYVQLPSDVTTQFPVLGFKWVRLQDQRVPQLAVWKVTSSQEDWSRRFQADLGLCCVLNSLSSQRKAQPEKELRNRRGSSPNWSSKPIDR
mmetsp:Transcript_30307/g.56233  ORF Transcript_30307/g.56233 Transcript_30307/m.56233 type:complete len:107 (-) Transcript_30307:424-744(-)